MKVYTYSSHHDLPFWRCPTNPNWIFDPNAIEGWTLTDDSKVPAGQIPIEKHWVIPILNGLLKVDAPGLVANVSMAFDTQKKMILPTHRCWVQITTEPKNVAENGMPEVVKDGVVQVEGVWGSDNGTRTPYDWIQDMDWNPKKLPDSDFWQGFFVTKLNQQLEFEKKKLLEAQETCRQHTARIARLKVALKTE